MTTGIKTSSQEVSKIKTPEGRTEQAKRLMSLDAFRGLTIVGMLLVNNIALDDMTPGHLIHAKWNGGVTFADMVFPWFLLIVGIAIPYAKASHFKKNLSKWNYFSKSFSRMVTLILLGCLIDSSIIKQPVLGLGVLQLIGIAYFTATILYNLPQLWRIITAILLLISHWALIKFFPVPGMEPGMFTEEYNVINFINQIYLTPVHLKGLISAVPTTSMVLIGTVTGDLLKTNLDHKKKFIYMLLGGFNLGLIGYLWNLDLPFNKPVWTASYILYTAGWGIFVLSIMYLLIDMAGWSRWSYPLIIFGVNPILAYIMPILFKIHILQEWSLPGPDNSTITLLQTFLKFCISSTDKVTGGCLYTLSYIVFWWIIMYCFYRKKIFLRV